MTEAKIGVVIPFFQGESGILARALRSVARQTQIEGVQVVVVDDSSPVSAKAECEQAGDVGVPVTVLEQANGGPGAARNRALDHLAGNVEYIAFLDSDDEWRSHHLENALQALSAGNDCYFANLIHLDQEVSAFDRRKHLRDEDHPAIDEIRGLRQFAGNMLEQIVTGNVIGTSTVTYRFGPFGTVRFRPEYRRAGEDYLFWMTLAEAGARFCFGKEVDTDYGRGVNVYSAAGWGTDGFPQRVLDELRYRRHTLRDFVLTPKARNHVRGEVRRLSSAFLMDLAHRIRHRKGVPWPAVQSMFALQPLWPLRAAVGLVSRRS